MQSIQTAYSLLACYNLCPFFSTENYKKESRVFSPMWWVFSKVVIITLDYRCMDFVFLLPFYPSNQANLFFSLWRACKPKRRPSPSATPPLNWEPSPLVMFVKMAGCTTNRSSQKRGRYNALLAHWNPSYTKKNHKKWMLSLCDLSEVRWQ